MLTEQHLPHRPALALMTTYTLASPAAAVFSAILPRAVDMNSIGRGSNAHGLSGLLGLVAFAVAAAPGIGAILGTQLLGYPAIGPPLLLLWCAVALLIARLLFALAQPIFHKRRENLAMLM